MTLDPRTVIDSPFGLSLAYLICSRTPNRMASRITGFIADQISARKSWKMVRAARCNQWVVHDERLEGVALDRLVADNFRSIASSIFDLYHNINNSTAFLNLIEPHPTAIDLVKRPEFSNRGLVVAGVHLSNFDLVFQMGGLAGMKAIALTLPELSAGYQKQLKIRVKKGMNVMQANVGTLKHAINHLRSGGMVITGIDRPDNGYPYHPKFFGHPSALPTHHVFLALKAQVPIIVGATIKQPDGKYHFLFSDPIELQPHPDRHTEIVLNTEMILRVAENFIRSYPTQWSMTFPVWPEAMDRVPK